MRIEVLGAVQAWHDDGRPISLGGTTPARGSRGRARGRGGAGPPFGAMPWPSPRGGRVRSGNGVRVVSPRRARCGAAGEGHPVRRQSSRFTGAARPWLPVNRGTG